MKNIFAILTTAALAFAFSGTVNAKDVINYNYVQGVVGHVDTDVGGINAAEVAASVELGANTFVVGEVGVASFDSFTLTQSRVGLGLNTDRSKAFGVYGVASLEDARGLTGHGVHVRSVGSVQGWGVETGVRYAVTPKLELTLAGERRMYDLTGRDFNVNNAKLVGTYALTDSLSLTGLYRDGGNNDRQYGVGVRWNW